MALQLAPLDPKTVRPRFFLSILNFEMRKLYGGRAKSFHTDVHSADIQNADVLMLMCVVK